jgi:hypothetical protein
MPSWNPMKKSAKNRPKNYRRKLALGSKSQNSIFCHFFFDNVFNRFKIIIKFCIFLCPYCIFKKNFFDHIRPFLQILNANADKTAEKNRKYFFYKCVLEIRFATINSLGEPSF